jgi:thiamine biosynthesis lipoprotein
VALTRRQALGTTVELVVHPPTRVAAAQAVVDSLLDHLDRAASRFREDSELSRLNRSAGTPHQVGPLLAELVAVALEAARTTDGLVDPTVGGPLIEAGYARDFAQISDDQAAPIKAGGLELGWRRVQLQGDTVQLPLGMLLDLGATAKAWAADRTVSEIAVELGCSALVSLGGDLATAGPPPPGGWVVRVADDHHPGSDGLGQNVRLTSPALATSSTTQRRWTRRGQRMHHIIDPRTGRPAEGPWRTISVAGASCVAANTASTASIVAGRAAPRWLLQRSLPARLVSAAGTALHMGGWPCEGDEMPQCEDVFVPTPRAG